MKKNRTVLEPELAASVLYYDKNEFEHFCQLWKQIEDNEELSPSGQFHIFMKLLTKLKRNEEMSVEEILANLRRLNDSEPSNTKREQFEVWLDQVVERDNPENFQLSRGIINRYLWFYHKDRIEQLDKSEVPFEEKLEIRPIKFQPSLQEKLFLDLDDIHIPEKELKTYTTGISSLDEYIELTEANLFIIASRPSVGKSVFMLRLALENSLRGVPTSFISLEMKGKSIKQRIINWYKGYQVPKEKYKHIENEKGYKDFKSNIKIITNCSQNGDVIFDIMRQSIELHGTKIFCIDYLQLIRFHNLNEFGSLREMTYRLKRFANLNDVIVVTGSQVSRETATFGVELHNLFGSSSIEHDSDIVCSLEPVNNREKIDNSDERFIFLKILKNREGLAGKIFKYNAHYIPMLFEETF